MAPWLPAAVIVLGAVLRAIQYAVPRSSTLDESALALGIIHQPWGRLFEPLPYFQVAPRGFLALAKLAILPVGPTTHALRAVPFIAGLVALPAFWMLAKRALPPGAARLALLFFAISPHLTYYASEIKPYSVDVAVVTLLTVGALRLLDEDVDARRVWLSAAAGVAAAWLSQPALLALGGLGAMLLMEAVRRDVPAARGRLLIACVAVCGLNALIVVAAGFSSLTPAGRAYMESFWADSFVPISGAQLEPFLWFARTAYGLVYDVLGMPVVVVGLAAAIAGGVWLARTRPRVAAALLAPMAVALVASALRLYPFAAVATGGGKAAAGEGRVLLFLTPALMLLVVAGLTWLAHALPPRHRLWSALPIGALLAPLAWYGAATLPHRPQNLNPLLAHLRSAYRPNDLLYVYYEAYPSFLVHRRSVPVDDTHVIRGVCARSRWRQYLRQIDGLGDAHRIWVLVAHPSTIAGIREADMITGYLGQFAERREHHGGRDAYLELYEVVSRPPGADQAFPGVAESAEDLPLGKSCHGVFDAAAPTGDGGRPPDGPPE